MENNETIESLVAEVQAKTYDELIPWEITASDTSFSAPMGGNYLLRVNEVSLRPSGTLYVLQITDADGDVITASSSRQHPVISEIYSKARNQALGIDKAISSVLEDLRRLKK